MANDRYCYLVLEESLPEGTIAEHRKSRRPKAKSSVLAKRRRPSTERPVIEPSARPRPSA
jgi:hypothetical protein